MLILAMVINTIIISASEPEQIIVADCQFFDEFGRIYSSQHEDIVSLMTLNNIGTESSELKVINALYSENKLINAQINKITLDGKSQAEIKFVTNTSVCNTNATVKNFVIDKNIRPVCESFILTPDGIENEIDVQLQRIKKCYDDSLLEWLASVYDPISGGFYYSLDARNFTGFGADIESTSQFLNIAEVSGLKPVGKSFCEYFGDQFSEKIVSYICARQNEANGYFYDPQYPQSRVAASKLERNLTQAKVMLKRFESSPLYLYPDQRQVPVLASTSSLPEYMQSAENFRAWMEALPWDTAPYAAANQLSAQQYTADAMGYTLMITEFLVSIQNKATGLWGRDLSYEAINASLKVSVYFNPQTEPYPNAEKMLSGVVHILDENLLPPQTASELWNPVALLNFAKVSGAFDAEKKIRFKEALPVVLKWTAQSLEDFKKPDGGFSYGRFRSTPLSQNMPVSLGRSESDMNATMLCINIWDKCHSVANRPAAPIFDCQDSDRFLKMLRGNSVFSKVCIPEKVYSEGFTGYRSVYDTLWTIYAPDGAAKLSNDELTLRAKSEDAENIQLIAGIYTAKENLYKIRVEMKLKVLESGGTPIYYNSLSDSFDGGAFQWLIVGKQDGFTINNRETSSGIGSEVTPLLENDRWYTLTIDYEPKGEQDTKITYYIDGEVTAETNRYSGYGVRPPVANADMLTLRSFKQSNSTIMIDDITVSNVCIQKVYSESFTGYSSVYDTMWTIYAPDGAAKLSNDDLTLRAKSEDAENIQLIAGIYTAKENLYKIRVEMKLKVLESGGTPIYYNSLSDSFDGGAFQWLIVGKQDGFTINNRETSSGIGSEVTPLLENDRWYTLTIDYEPKGEQDTKITYYIDGEVTAETNRYSGYGVRPPVANADMLTLRSFKQSNSTIMIDDIVVYAY